MFSAHTIRRCGPLWLSAAALCSSPVDAGLATCDADLDKSGVVTGLDLAMLLGGWGTCPTSGGGQCLADLDASGSVNGFDLGLLLGAWGKCPFSTPPKIIYTPVAHEGDPAPGIPLPGSFIDQMLPPQIDAAGNVLFASFIGAPGLGEVGNFALFHGTPGNIQKLAWETDPAPDMPPGVTIKSLHSATQRIAETGQITFRADVTGPGIISGVNDSVLYTGNPSQGVPMHKFLQTGDPAPGLPGLTLTTDDGDYFGVETQSDNGTLLLISVLAGPGVDQSNDIAWWTGTADNLQLVYREGMPAPGTWEGVVFKWADLITVNDLGQMAFRGVLAGPGIIDGVNSQGRWIGGPGELQLVAWAGLPAPGMPAGVSIAGLLGGLTCTNNAGHTHAAVQLEGRDVTFDNDEALFAGPGDAMQLVAREGDPVPEAGEEVEIDTVSSTFMNDLGEIMYVARLRGPSVTLANQWAKFFGSYAEPSMTLRSGDPAPLMSPGTIMTNAAIGLIAMNDVRHIVTVVEVAGPGITSQIDTVALLRDPVSKQWQPIIQGGMTLDSQTVSLPEYSDLGFWWQSGGSDGYGLSLNDAGQFVVQIPFTDGTDGIYIVQQMPAAK